MPSPVLESRATARRWSLDWPRTPKAAPCAACGSRSRVVDTERFGGIAFCEACLEHVAQHAYSDLYDDLGGGD